MRASLIAWREQDAACSSSVIKTLRFSFKPVRERYHITSAFIMIVLNTIASYEIVTGIHVRSSRVYLEQPQDLYPIASRDLPVKIGTGG